VKWILETGNACLEHSDTLSPILCACSRRIFIGSFLISAASGSTNRAMSLELNE
jgi:hypothetical protein